MAQDDIPGVRGAPGGSGGRQGAPGGARGSTLPPAAKKVMVEWFIALWRFLHGDVSSTVLKTWKTREKMAPNHGLKYPKCILTQKGWFLFISEAFGAFWMIYNSSI